MSDWHDPILYGVIFGLIGVDIFCGYWLARANGLIKRMTEALKTAERELNEGATIIRAQSELLQRRPSDAVDPKDMSPLERAAIRKMLLDEVERLQRMEH